MRLPLFGLIRSTVLILMGIAFGPSSALSAEPEPSGIWTGSYSCSKQERIATLTFIDEETARFDFKPGKDAKPFAAGAYTMNVWRKGNELLMRGSEWIQEPRGFTMVPLQVAYDGNELKGIVDSKNCSEITLKAFDASKSEESGHVGIPEGTVFPIHLSGTYQCKNQSKEGSYWELSKTPTGDLALSLTTRATNQPSRAKQFELILGYSDDHYLGMEQSGAWGVKLAYSSGNDLPLIEFVGRNGKTDSINCSIPEIESADDAKTYWDNYFNEAGDKEMDIDTALSAGYRYITLPNASMLAPKLSALEIEDYKTQRAELWKALPVNYVASMPEKIKSIPVDTAEDRKQARTLFQSMEFPGFRHKLNVTYLYHSHLLNNGVSPEPLFFSDTESACKRVGTVNNHVNGMAAVEKIVGLPAREWNDQAIEAIISTVEACAKANTALEKPSGFLLQGINKQVPNLRAVVERMDWIFEKKKTYLEKPRNLATLIETNNYQLSRQELQSNRISQPTYEQEFVTKMQEASTEAKTFAKTELDSIFTDEQTKALPVKQQFLQCQKKLNTPNGFSPNWLKELNTICFANSKKLLSEHFVQLKKGLNERLASAKAKSPKDLIQFIRSDSDPSLIEISSALRMNTEFRNYERAFDELKKNAIVNLDQSVKEEFELNNEESNTRIKALCSDQSTFRMISNTCNEIIRAIANQEKERQCESMVTSLDIPKEFINDTLLYGEVSDTKEIQISDFSCQLSLKGIDVSISDDGAVVGVEPKYGREIFSTELLLVNDKSTPKYWEFAEISVNRNYRRLNEKRDSARVKCLLECDF